MQDKTSASALFGIIDPSGARGFFHVSEHGEPKTIFQLISACLSLPECSRPPMQPYRSHTELLAIASLMNADFIYEMGFDAQGQPTLLSAIGAHVGPISMFLVAQETLTR